MKHCELFSTNSGSSRLQDNCTLTYLPSHKPRKTSKTCWWGKDEFMSDVVQWTHRHGHTSVNQQAKTYIHQLCADIGCRLEGLLKTLFSTYFNRIPLLFLKLSLSFQILLNVSLFSKFFCLSSTELPISWPAAGTLCLRRDRHSK